LLRPKKQSATQSRAGGLQRGGAARAEALFVFLVPGARFQVACGCTVMSLMAQGTMRKMRLEMKSERLGFYGVNLVGEGKGEGGVLAFTVYFAQWLVQWLVAGEGTGKSKCTWE
jgi:hypothetical protein